MLVFFYLATNNLANFHPVSEDDVWIMSASYKLAHQGVFGSDLYAGFFDADSRYYISLPGLHLLQALTFRLFGSGIVQARLPVTLAGVSVLWLVCDMARRWYGKGASLLTALLFLIWRADIIGADARPPLLQVSQNWRYDVVALAFIWLTIWLLDRLLTRSSRKLAFSVGLSAAAATLTQFFGLLVLPLVLLGWLRARRSVQFRALSVWLLAGFLALALAYVLYIMEDLNAFSGQAQLKQGRTGFTHIGFYLSNLSRELSRYVWLVEELWPTGIKQLVTIPWGRALMVLGLIPAIVITLLVDRKQDRISNLGSRKRGDSLLTGYLFVISLGLALVDSTKAPLYAIVLWPGLVMTFAVAGSTIWVWLRKSNVARQQRVLFVLVLLPLLLLALADGLGGLRLHLKASQKVSAYLTVGARINSSLAPEASVLGSDRWWWALREHPYLAVNNLWAQWQAAKSVGAPITFSELVTKTGTSYLLVNNNVRGNIHQYPQELHRQFWGFLEQCASLQTVIADRTYGQIEIFLLAQDDCSAS
jgi:4-amino-4-deoxy-L-arabinose transferase-like glycosyltransferase